VPFGILASGGYTPSVPGEMISAPPPDSHLIIEPISELINTTFQDFVLRHDFGIRYARTCNGTTGEGLPDCDLYFFADAILFSLDLENGRMPDITAAGACSTPLGAVRIAKESKNEKGEACPVLKSGQTCALST